MGISTSDSLLILTLLNILTAIPLLLKSSRYFSSRLLLVSSLWLIGTILFETYVPLALCAFVAALQCARDLFYVDLMAEYGVIQEKCNVAAQKVIALSMLTGIIVISSLLPISGLLSSIDTDVYFIAIGAVGIALVAVNQMNTQSITKADAALPNHLPTTHWLSSISMFSNGSIFFTRYFIVPYFILTASKSHGLESSALPITGTLIGIVSVLGVFLRNSTKSDSSRSDMCWAFYASMISCLFIAGAIKYVEIDLNVAIVLFGIGFFSLEVSCKIWTISYIAYFKSHAESVGEERHCYTLYARYKAIGAFTSFGLAWVSISYTQPSIIIAIQVFIALCFVTYILINNMDVLENQGENKATLLK